MSSMNEQDVKILQKTLAYCIYHNQKDFMAYKTISKYFPPKIFWDYSGLIEFIEWRTFEDMEISKISTDIVTQWLSQQYVEMITCEFTISNFFRDVRELLKYKFWWVLKAEDFKKYVFILNQINDAEIASQSNKYLIDNMYDEMMNDLARKSDAMESSGAFWYSYWFSLIDKITKWIQKRKVTRISAYSNTGKSKFTYQLFNTLLNQWCKIIYFSLEVDAIEILEQIFQSRFWLKTEELIKQKGFENINLDELFWKWEQLHIIDDKYNLDDIINYTEYVKPDVVILDFVQNIEVPWATTEYQAMTKVALKLQQMAKQNNLALMDISQISNDQAKSNWWMTFKAKGSGALVASADVLLTMTPTNIEWLIELEVSKNKFWPNRQKINLSVDFDRVRFKEIWFAETFDNSEKDIPL